MIEKNWLDFRVLPAFDNTLSHIDLEDTMQKMAAWANFFWQSAAQKGIMILLVYMLLMGARAWKR